MFGLIRLEITRDKARMQSETTKEKRNWKAIEFQTDAENEDLASWLMIQGGSCGCQVEAAENGHIRITATFENDALSGDQLEKVKASLEEYGLAEALQTLRMQTIEEEDWLVRWKEGYEPFAVGDRFLVCPPWELDNLTDEQKAGRQLIVIEPGMAFGTGLHDTTQYCMRALEQQKSVRQVVDVGTGSAILAIACARIFPEAEITGVDTDPVAIELSEKNCQLNGVEKQIKLVTGSTESVRGQKFDCILSNLTAEDNVALLPEYMELLTQDGVIICAGILREKLHLIEAALQGLQIADRQLTQMWAGITLKRV
ncbi:MAG TPA: 50S ribosomal protein L11 methyltransferase [Chroococcales cyanobacterium]